MRQAKFGVVTLQSEIEKTCGDYADFDELETLTTWRDTSGNGDTTTWRPDPASGVLLDKTYADGTAIAYEYHDNGLLRERKGQRNLTATYSYTNAGDLSGITYSDGVTPAVAITEHDRLGRPRKITDAGGTCTLTYHATIPALLSETYDPAPAALPDVTVASTLESATGRRTGLTVSGAGSTHSVGFTPDEQGRLETVTNTSGGFSHTYEYHPGTALVASINHQQGGNTFATQTTHTDFAGQVTGIETKSADNTPLVRHGYQYDPAGRRTRATREDGTYWEFGYNPRGEVTAGKKHLPSGTLLAGHQFEYQYDEIGNREFANSGGDASGNNLRTINYGTANSVNQYETVTHPGSYDVLGRAEAASVTVKAKDHGAETWTNLVVERPATPFADLFRAEPAANNNPGNPPTPTPVWQDLEVADGTTTKTGHHFVPARTTTLVYDPDGNLAFDGRWNYTWDADNRLVRMTTAQPAVTAGVPYRALRFTYDWQGRRIRKQVLGPNESPISDHRFAYDGWNLLAEYTASGSTLTLLRGYAWGLDLSGSEQGAGGVGGLLSVNHSGSEYAPCYDGNGNVIAWLACVNGSANVVCRHEFDPFGNRIMHEGSLDLPIGFSTKYRDEETGLLYYGLRYLHTLLGRWPNRDPIKEKGGLNLYGFVGNNAITRYDYLGAWFADGLGRKDGDGHGFVLDGSGGLMVELEGGNNKWQKLHEETHVAQIAGGTDPRGDDIKDDEKITVGPVMDWHAIPYKQQFTCCIEDSSGKPAHSPAKIGWCHFQNRGTSTAPDFRRVFGNKDDPILWGSRTAIWPATNHEIAGLELPVIRWEKRVSGKNLKKLTQWESDLKPHDRASKVIENQTWTAYKKAYHDEQERYKKNGWTWVWRDKTKLYKAFLQEGGGD